MQAEPAAPPCTANSFATPPASAGTPAGARTDPHQTEPAAGRNQTGAGPSEHLKRIRNMFDKNRLFCFKGAVFDLDGTLVDSEPVHLLVWQDVCRKYQLPVMTLDYIQHFGGMSTISLCEMMCEENHRRDLDYMAVANEKSEIYRQKYMDTVPLNPYIASLMKEAHARGLKTAVATGSRLPETEYLLKKFGLMPAVDAIVTSDQVPKAKPAPDTYLISAQRLGLDPRFCVAFEDTDLGLRGIRAAGMTAVKVAKDKIISDFITP